MGVVGAKGVGGVIFFGFWLFGGFVWFGVLVFLLFSMGSAVAGFAFAFAFVA